MSFFGDIVTAGDAAINAMTGSSSTQTSAPVPTVPGGPPKAKPVSYWTAPDASGSGQFSVHRDVLRSVARSMQPGLKDIDTAVGAMQGIVGSAGSIRGWSTGNAFSGNASNAFHAIAQAGTHAGNAQQAASKNLIDSASTYDAAESDSQRAISGVGTQPNATSGWGPAAGASAVPASASASTVIPSIDVKTNSVAESDVTGMTAPQIMEILHRLPSGEVAAAGAAATRMGSTLEQVATQVTRHAHTLAQNWTGSAAQAAMVQFQTLHNQAATLAQQTTQTGAVLSWLGNEVLPRFKALPDPTPASPVATDAREGAAIGEHDAGAGGAVVGAIGGTIVGAVSGLFGGNGQAQAQANQTAQQYLRALNTYLVQANQALPSPVGLSNSSEGGGGPAAGFPSGGPRSGAAVPASGYPGGGASGAGAGAGTGSVPGTGGTTRLPRVTPVPGDGGSGTGVLGYRGVPGGGSPVPTMGKLQGVTLPAGGSPTPSLGPTGTPVTGPAGPATGMPTGLPIPGLGSDEFPADAVPDDGMVGIPEASGLTASDVVAQDAVVQSAVGQDAVAQGAVTDTDGLLAQGAEGQADYGMTGLPATGSGAAEREKERRRRAWLDEEADIWGLPSDNVPSVIEGGG
jgi:hypothetical protein